MVGITVKIIGQYAPHDTLATSENISVTITTGRTEIFLSRDEALYLVAELGKRLMQLSVDPDLAVAGKAVEDAMDQAVREARSASGS